MTGHNGHEGTDDPNRRRGKAQKAGLGSGCRVLQSTNVPLERLVPIARQALWATCRRCCRMALLKMISVTRVESFLLCGLRRSVWPSNFAKRCPTGPKQESGSPADADQ